MIIDSSSSEPSTGGSTLFSLSDEQNSSALNRVFIDGTQACHIAPFATADFDDSNVSSSPQLFFPCYCYSRILPIRYVLPLPSGMLS